MGVSLNHPADQSVNWFSTVDGNWTTIETQYWARQKADTSTATVTGSTSETVLMNNTTIPANALSTGVVLMCYTAGTIALPASTTTTPTWRLRWGGLTGPVLVAFTPYAYSTGGATGNTGWTFDTRVICTAAGASGTAETDGWTFTGGGTLVPGAFGTSRLAATATIDTTAAKSLVWTIQLDVAAVSVTQRLMLTNRG